MPDKITLGGLAPIDVDLFGEQFQAVPATKSVLQGIQDGWQVYLKAEGTDAEVKALAEVVDLRLKANGPAGKAKKPSEVIVAKWDADEVTVGQILGFLENLAEADRPT